MWSFFVELIEINKEESDNELPYLLFSLGDVPNNVPEKKFKSEKFDLDEDDEDDFDIGEYLD